MPRIFHISFKSSLQMHLICILMNAAPVALSDDISPGAKADLMDKIRAWMCNKLPGSNARKVRGITVIRRDFFQQVLAEEKVMEMETKAASG